MKKLFATFLFLVFLISGCGFKNHIQTFANSVENKINASELDNWATNVLANGHVSEIGMSVPLRDFVRSAENTEIINDAKSGDRIVVIVFGGGFGHQGIAIGTPGYKSYLGNDRIAWTNGIWFWSE
jgi:UDP-N-acetylglucosamine:LPS N-acetylglucosamine transferase